MEQLPKTLEKRLPDDVKHLKSSKHSGLSQFPNDKVFSSTEVIWNLLIKTRSGGIKALWSGKPCSYRSNSRYTRERDIRHPVLHPSMSYGVLNQITRHRVTSCQL